MADQLAPIKTEDDEVSLGDVSKPSNGLNRDSSANDYIFASYSCLFKTLQIECEKCNCYLKDELTRDEHMRLEDNLVYKCHSASCRDRKSLRFNDWNELNNHMKKHTDFIFQCSDCVYTAKTMVNLERHRGLYHQNGVFACAHESCAYVFSSRTAVLSHFRMKHTDCTVEQWNAIREIENFVGKNDNVKPEPGQPIKIDPTGDAVVVTGASGAAATVTAPVPVATTNTESTLNENIFIESSANIEKALKNSYTSTDSTITGTVVTVSSSTLTDKISIDSIENIENPTQNSSNSTDITTKTALTTTIEQQPSDTDSSFSNPDRNSLEISNDLNPIDLSTIASTSDGFRRQTRSRQNTDELHSIRKQPSRGVDSSSSNQGIDHPSSSKKSKYVPEEDEEEEISNAEIEESEDVGHHNDGLEPNLNPTPRPTTQIEIHYMKCSEKDCKMGYSTNDELHDHLLNYHKIKPFQCYARGCNQRFTKRELGGHISFHKNIKYQCPPKYECSKVCNSQKELAKHIRRKHQLGMYECASVPGCTFKASLRCKIYSHCRTKHRPDDYKCREAGCNGRKFRDSFDLKKHQSTHHQSQTTFQRQDMSHG